MVKLHDLLAGSTNGGHRRLSLPEHRQIELYSKRKALAFVADEPSQEAVTDEIRGVCGAFMVLDSYLMSRMPDADGKTSWQRVLDLPRASLSQRLVAELYRVLRVAWSVAFAPQGTIDIDDGIVRIKGIVRKTVLTLDITPMGLLLLESATVWSLDALRQPYPDAYVAAMLSQYFFDIIGEIKRFNDEDRALYQFRRTGRFNRHARFDCDNPKAEVEGDFLRIEISPLYRDPALYPIDFFVMVRDTLHIIPVEALTDGALPLVELDKWRARVPDGVTLPASFRQRFWREVPAINQPMT
ncbi:hypothetical protein [Rhodopila globiformis]|uniref:Uncharacterized protein n=1 Tax=Rhodopila globiformis TaxID=1071 RepID=A0A2S6NMT3_RHOGL|nr:hypothetical protein [Rhodopila globiformis]PPQ37773.1 hypothetical protein CCS01_03115 [Rhodopila globiformis]